MSQSFFIQFAASLAAVAALVALAAWAKIAKPMTPLTDERARTLLEQEFPGRRLERIWVAVDGRGALAKSGSGTLTLTKGSTYNGTLTVSAGTLINNGSNTAAIAVSGGTYFRGAGSNGAVTASPKGACRIT